MYTQILSKMYFLIMLAQQFEANMNYFGYKYCQTDPSLSCPVVDVIMV